MLKTWTDSPTHTFFATTPPGLESLCLKELEEMGLEIAPPKVFHGGIEFEAPRELLPKIIRHLKIPTHLLWRLGSFRVRDFPKLYSKVKSISWAHFIVSEEINIKVSATNSRLMHSGRIEKTLRDALKTSLAARAPKKDLIKRYESLAPESRPTLYARLDNDTLSLSLDLAGENLHRRSGAAKKHIGAAPLRENLAHACLMIACDELRERGELPHELCLWDPFCGSGTILSESLSWRAPSDAREYALDIFEPSVQKGDSDDHSLFKSHLGSDLDAKIIAAAKKNLSHYDQSKITLKNEEVKVAIAPDTRFVIVTNPPYGERIKSTNGLSSLYEKWPEFENCLGLYVLVPHHLAPKSATALIKFSHGGISVGLYKL